MTRRPQVASNRSDVLKLAPHPLGPTTRTLSRWADQQRTEGRAIAVDLFSGAGGLSAGIEAAGWAVAAAVDTDARALETHRHNFPGLALDLDLGEKDARDTFVELFADIDVDLVAGGPPCQPFSRAGRSKIRSLVEAGVRDKTDLRRELWQAFLDTALRLHPRAILMENVPDMGLGDDFAVVRLMVDELETAGYRTDVRIADAWKYGVPQHRKRLILLARRDAHDFYWPEPVAKMTTLRSAIADLPPLDGDIGARELAYIKPGRTEPFTRQMRHQATRGVIHDHMTRRTRDDDRKIFAMMDSRTLYSDIPEHLRRYNADSFTDKYKRLGWDELSRSITAHIAKDGYWYIHPSETRTLTVREAARIQTFPDRFRFSGTRSDAFRQIGNAVPPLLGQAAASAVAPRPERPDTTTPNWYEARQALASWAHSQRNTDYWFMVPGPAMTPPVALAAAALSRARQTPGEVGQALQRIRGLAHYTTGSFNGAASELPPNLRRAFDRLRPLLRARKIWATPDQAAELVKLNESERRLYRVLSGQDVLLVAPNVLRVAARVAGTASHETNRLTDGRLDVARLVGSGPDAAARMAGLRLIATTTCGPDAARCGSCPLTTWCASSRENALDQTIHP